MPITFHIPTIANADVSVEDVDILQQHGVKVIHCSRAFDTHTSVVRSGSVFSQLLNRCEELGVDVDEQIDAWLEQIKNKGLYKENMPYRKRIFNTGEICPIVTDDGIVCLAGFCNTTNSFMAESVTLIDYMAYWSNVWYNLSQLTIDKQHVHVTVPGGRIINISGCEFDLDQSIAIILHTYFKFLRQFATAIPHLHICIGKAGYSHLNLEMWKSGFMQYLYNFASLPIDLVPSHHIFSKTTSQASLAKNPNLKTTPFDKLISDIKEMFDELAKHNGEEIDQFEGSKRVTVEVTTDKAVLFSILEGLRSYTAIESFFGRQKGDSYDRNALFILIGILIDQTTCFGKLNRRSVMTLCLANQDSRRWSYLGDNIDNIITYVGQRMTKFKAEHNVIYDQVLSSIPDDYIRKK